MNWNTSRFRNLLEKPQLGEEMLETVNHYLASKDIQIATGRSSMRPLFMRCYRYSKNP